MSLHAILNAVSSAIIIHQGDTVRFANTAAQRLTGYDAEAFAALPLSLLVAPESQAALAAGKGELKLFTAQGKPLWVDFSAEQVDYEGESAMLCTLVEKSDYPERTLLDDPRFVEDIARTIPDLIHVYDLQEQRNVYANREITHMLGYTPEALQQLGESLLTTLMHPDDLAKQRQHAERFLTAQDGDLIEDEFRWRHSDGDWRWIYTRDTVFTRNPDDTPKQILGVAQDITERRRAEDALRRSEKLYRTLAHNFPNGAVIMFDHDLRYLLVEGQELERMGYQREKMEGQTIWEVLPAQVAQRVEPVYRAALDGQTQVNIIEGITNTYLLYTLPLHDDNGEVYAGMGIAINITEQKRAEEALRRSEERLKYLLTNAPVAIFSAAPSGDFDVRFVSENVLHLTGFTPQELISDPTLWTNHIHPEDTNWVQEKLTETLLTGKNDYEYRFLCKDGTYKWTHEEIRLIRNTEGQPVEMVGYWQDISQRKEMERALVQQERLHVALQKEKELGDLKSKMMERISHEFRTPLSVITMSSELMERYHERMTPEKRQQHFQRIRNGVVQIATLLDDTSLAVKGLADYLDFVPVPLDLTRLCQDIADEARGTLVSTHRLDLMLPSDPLHVTADRDLVRRIILNLLNNAVKFSTPGKAIRLEASPDDDACLIRIRDEGIGISPEDQARIFEPFYRGSNIGERQGLGLGLCIVQNAVDLHQGRLHVESALGKGATFTVRLPLSP